MTWSYVYLPWYQHWFAFYGGLIHDGTYGTVNNATLVPDEKLPVHVLGTVTFCASNRGRLANTAKPVRSTILKT